MVQKATRQFAKARSETAIRRQNTACSTYLHTVASVGCIDTRLT
jgi:hypothetical protein